MSSTNKNNQQINSLYNLFHKELMKEIHDLKSNMKIEEYSTLS
jgi:hypothetical protein